MLYLLKNIIIELFYWCWVPFHYLHGSLQRLNKKLHTIWLKKKLHKRKDCKVQIGEKWNLFPDVSVIVEPNSSLAVGDHVCFMDHTRIAARKGGKLVIGDNTLIGRYCIISCWYDVVIEENVLMSNMIWITDHQHEFDLKSPVSFGKCGNLAPVRIKSGTWIGNKVTIMEGVTIGRNCVIGANSVVTRDIPEGCVAVGVPARVIKTAADLEKDKETKRIITVDEQ